MASSVWDSSCGFFFFHFSYLLCSLKFLVCLSSFMMIKGAVNLLCPSKENREKEKSSNYFRVTTDRRAKQKFVFVCKLKPQKAFNEIGHEWTKILISSQCISISVPSEMLLYVYGTAALTKCAINC